jgi:hypothetical protein
MILVVGASTNVVAHTPMHSREGTLDVEVSIDVEISIRQGYEEILFINYIPIEEARYRVTITTEVWQFGRMVESYTRRHFFWHTNRWGYYSPSLPSLGTGPYRIIVILSGDENEVIRLYERIFWDPSQIRLVDTGTEVKIVKNDFYLPWYVPTLLVVALAVFATWYIRRFPYREAYPLCSDGCYG